MGTSDFYVCSLEKDGGHFDISRFGDTLLRKYAPAGNVPSRMMTKARASVNELPAKNIARLQSRPFLIDLSLRESRGSRFKHLTRCVIRDRNRIMMTAT